MGPGRTSRAWYYHIPAFVFFRCRQMVKQIGENQVLFNIQDADNINHIVVFMTGQTPFPDGLGGAGN